MGRRSIVGLTLGIWAVVAHFPGPRAHATVMERIALDVMVAEATVIVRGVVEQSGVQVALTDGAPEPHTLTRIRVIEQLKGSTSAHVTIHELGGEWAGGGSWISGAPHYTAGEDVIVFLRPDPERSGVYRTFGMAQGKFRITEGAPGHDGVVTQDLEGLAFASWTERGQMEIHDATGSTRTSLALFLSTVRAMVSGAER